MLWRLVLARPLTGLYAMASVIIVAASAHWVERNAALVMLSAVFVVSLVLGLYRDYRLSTMAMTDQLVEIHVMVNSRYSDLEATNVVLIERVNQLVQVMQVSDVTVPEPAEKGMTP